MFSSKDGKMIILSSPSGAGKTTLVKKISKEKNFKISVSHTTRKPRPNEINGTDYFFTTQKNFEELIKEKWEALSMMKTEGLEGKSGAS